MPHRAADILEIDVDAFGTGRRELYRKIGGAMINGGVEAQVFDDVAGLFSAAGNANGAGAGHLGELPDQRANRAAGGGDDHGVARFRLADPV